MKLVRMMIQRLFKWIERQARWSSLRGYGNSPIIRTTVLMPVVGYLILLNERISDWLRVHAAWLPEGTGYDPGMNIFFLFYGTIFLGVGSFLFSVFCHPRIKKYESDVDFISAARSYYEIRAHLEPLTYDLKVFDKEMAPWQYRLPEFNGMRQYFQITTKGREQDFPAEFYKDISQLFGDLTNILKWHWHALDVHRRAVRITVYVLFVLGSFCVAVPAVVTFWRVTDATFRYWF